MITKFIRIGIENFASKRGSNKYFYHNDHLGSVNVVTDINRNRVQLAEYAPWGGLSRSEGSIDPDQRFTGQKLDPETGLYYYGGRYYDAEIGRFVSADPFVQTLFEPQNLNRYSYVINNPQNYIDPDGYFHRHKIKKGGFFSRFFGIFSIIVGILTLQPELAAIGAAETAINFTNILIGLGSIGAGVNSLANSGTGPGGIGPPGSAGDFGIQLAAANVSNGFFSPALRFAAETGCDVCDDPIFSGARIGMWFDFEGGFGGRRGRLRGIPAGGTPAEQERIYRAREARANSWRVYQGQDTIDDLVAGSRVISRSSRLIQLERPGRFNEANRLFDQLSVSQSVKTIPTPQGPVRAFELPGGRSISVRPFSSGDQPTIQIDTRGQPTIKIRFPD